MFSIFLCAMRGITVGTRDMKCSLIVVTTGTHAVDKVGQQVNGFADTVVGFGGWCIRRVSNGVSHGKILDNVGKREVVMVMVVLVLLA